MNAYLVYELNDYSTHPHKFAVKGRVYRAFLMGIKYHLMKRVYGVV